MRQSIKKTHRKCRNIIRHTNKYLEEEFGRYKIKIINFNINSESIAYLLLFIDTQDPLNTVSVISDRCYGGSTIRFFQNHLYEALNDYIIFCERGDNIQNRLNLSYMFYPYATKYRYAAIDEVCKTESNEHIDMVKNYIKNLDTMRTTNYKFENKNTLDTNPKYVINNFYMLSDTCHMIGNGIIIYQSESNLPICLYYLNNSLYLKYFKETTKQNSKRKFTETLSYSVKLNCKNMDEFYKLYDTEHLLEALMLLK